MWIPACLAHAAEQSGERIKTRKQGFQRYRSSPRAQPAGDFGNRHGARAPDWSGTAAPEFPAFAGSRSRIQARPGFGNGNSASRNFFRAVQPTFARRATRVRAEAGPAIRTNRRPNPDTTG